MERQTRSTPAQRDTREFERIQRLAGEIVHAFEDEEPLLTVMALRLAAQRIYDSRCRDRQEDLEEGT